MVEVGNTPMVEVEGIFAKVECTNPMGSIKDRIASYIIEESELRGLLEPGMEIVEASSGNTGIAFAYFGRKKGYSTTIVMPENMSRERKQILRVLGARLVFCPPGDFIGATQKRDEIVAADPRCWTPDQFSNPLNVQCHYETTAQEILDQMRERGRRIDAFVAGLGTGGTLIGTGKRLRETFPEVKVIAIEPAESAVISGGSPGIHGIQGIGGGFIPAIASDGAGGPHPLIDVVEVCSTEEAMAAAQYLSDERGLCVGISSGANFLVSRRVSERYGTTVTVFPDGLAKYRSQGLRPRPEGECQLHRNCGCPVKEICDVRDSGDSCFGAGMEC